MSTSSNNVTNAYKLISASAERVKQLAAIAESLSAELADGNKEGLISDDTLRMTHAKMMEAAETLDYIMRVTVESRQR